MNSGSGSGRGSSLLASVALLALSLVYGFPAGAVADTYSVTSLDLDPGKVLGINPVSLAYNPTAKKLYAVSLNGAVSIFNTLNNTWVTAMSAGDQNDLVVDSVNNKVYLTNGGGYLTVIDGVTDQVDFVWLGDAAASPRRIAVHPTNGRVYVTNYGNNTVSVVKSSDYTVVSVPVGTNPIGIGINGYDVYVANEGSGNVSVIAADPAIAAAFNKVVATIPIPSPDKGPAEVQVSGGDVYVLNRGNAGYDVQSSFAVIYGADRTLKPLVDGVGAAIRNPVLIPDAYWAEGLVVRSGTVTIRTRLGVSGNELHQYRIWSASAGAWLSSGPVEDVGGSITSWARNDVLKRLYLLANGAIHVVDIDSANSATTFNHVIATLPNSSSSDNRLALAIDAAGEVLYAAGGESNKVLAYDLSDNTLKATYFTGGGPNHLSVDSTRNAAWVGHYGGGVAGNLGVRKINGMTRAVTSIDTGLDSGYMALLNETTNWAYALTFPGGAIGMLPVDGSRGAIAGTIPLGITNLGDLELDKTKGRAYIVGDGTLKIVDVDPRSATFHSVVASVALGGNPEGIAFNNADNLVYIGNNEGYISVLKGATNTVASTITVARGSDKIAINQSTKLAYISSDGDPGLQAVRVVDVNPTRVATFNKVVAAIPIATTSEFIAVNETTNRVYVDVNGNNTVAVINGATGVVEATIAVPGSNGEKPLAIDAGLGRVYALDSPNNRVVVIDGNPASPTFNTVLQYIDVGWYPMSIGVNKNTHQVFVANAANNTVSVLVPVAAGSGTVSGTVLDGSSNPVGGVAVIATAEGCDGYLNSATTGADGKYSIPGLPAGNVYLQVRDSKGTSVYQWSGGVTDCTAATPVAVGTTAVDFTITPPGASPAFQAVMVFSENLQYDPVAFPSALPQHSTKGLPYWNMIAGAEVAGATASPVTLSSVTTGDYELAYLGAFGVYKQFWIDQFHNPTRSIGGDFAPPGPSWEGKGYTFSIGDARSYWYIPEGSLKQLPIPGGVKITGGENPVVSWNPVAGADSYAVWIYDIGSDGNPGNLLYMPAGTKRTYFSYGLGMLANGGSYAVRVMANQLHPSVDDPMYGRLLNRSSYYTRYNVLNAPAALTVPAGDPDGSYQVNWTASAETGVSYVLEEATDAAFTLNKRTVYSGVALTAPVAGRANATTYYYRVKVTKAGLGASPWQTAANGCAVAYAAVNPPLSITVPFSDPDGGFSVTWLASPSTAVTYVLEEATDNAFTLNKRTAYSGAALTAAIAARERGTYYYRVKARKTGPYVDSDWQAGANGCVVTKPMVAMPGSITVPPSPSAGSYEVSWLASATAAPLTYVLEEATDPAFTLNKRAAYTGALLKAAITGRVNGVTYYYRVKAKKTIAWTDSAWLYGANGCAVAFDTVANPGSMTVPNSVTIGSYNVSWGTSATAAPVTYVLEEATNPAFTLNKRIVYTGLATWAAITGRVNGVTYFYRVKAKKTIAWTDSDWRYGANGCAVAFEQVAAPVSLTVLANTKIGSYEVKWTDTDTKTPSSTYVLEEATDTAFTLNKRTAYTGLLKQAAITGRVNGVTYYYRVKAKKTVAWTDSAWLQGSNGCAVVFDPAGIPASITVPPTDFDGRYSVSWNPSATPLSTYTLEEATDDTFTTNLRTVYTGPALTAAVTDRAMNSTYYYRVKARKTGSSDSPWVSPDHGCVVMYQPEPPASISVPGSDSDGMNYTVSWDASVTPGVSYVLQEATNANFVGAAEYDMGIANSKDFTGRTLGLTYYYRVKATKAGLMGSSWRRGDNGCDISPLSRTTWVVGATDPTGTHDTNVLVFLDRSHYLFAKSISRGGDCDVDGIVHGNYSWNPADNSLTVTPVYVTPGFTCGFTEAVSVDVNGDTLTLRHPDGALQSFRLARTDNPIVGTWFGGDPDPAAQDATAFVILDDANFMLINNATDPGDPNPCGNSGLEHGTYKWDDVSENFDYQVVVDSTGCWGLGGPGGTTGTLGVVISDSGNLMTGTNPAEDPPDNTWTIPRLCGDGCGIAAGAPPSISVPVSSADGSNYTVSWAASSTADVSYALEEATAADFSDAQVIDSGTDLSYVVTNRTLGLSYYYRVKALKDGYAASAWRRGDNVCDISPLSHTAWSLGGTSPTASPREAHALVFLDKTHYMFGKSDNSDPNCVVGGIEHGVYSWNPLDNSFIATAVYVTPNFDCGLNGMVGTVGISGDTLTLDSPEEPAPIPLTRIAGTTNPIVGTWFIGNPDPTAGEDADALVFFNDVDFMLIGNESPNFPNPCGQPGMEHGNFTWNQGTGAFTYSNIAVDTNGCFGISESGAAGGKTIGITGNDMNYNNEVILKRLY